MLFLVKLLEALSGRIESLSPHVVGGEFHYLDLLGFVRIRSASLFSLRGPKTRLTLSLVYWH